MLLSQTEITGAEVHAVQLGEWLKTRSHQVTIISDTLNVKTSLTYLQRPIHPKGFFKRISNILFLLQFIKAHQIDVLHAHSRAAVRVGFWACLLSKATLVSTVHGRQHYSWSKKIFNLYGRHIIAVCQNLQQHLINDFGLKKDFITVIGNPVHSISNKTTDISVNSPLAVVGRTSGPKGEQTKRLIRDVFPKLLSQFPELKIHLLGGPVSTLGTETLKEIEALNNQYPGCLVAVTPDNLDQALRKYKLVFGAGRVAISSLLQGIPVWAIGENSSLGFLQTNNFLQACTSNFGDIGLSGKPSDLAIPQMISELEQFLMQPLPSDQERENLMNSALRVFEFSAAAEKIENIYKAAILYKKHPRHIPILMYHMITKSEIETKHRIFVTSDQFDKQLAAYQKWGYETLNFQDLEDFVSEKKSWSQFPKKTLILTFDDGYTNNLTEALPLLKKYNFKAVIYLLAHNDIIDNHWDAGEIPPQALMNSQERKSLFNSGFFEIGSHGLTHDPLTKMNFHEATHQLSESKSILEKEFGCKILSYAFTYGLRNDNLANEAFHCGYKYIVNTDQGGFHLSQPLTSIFRTPVFPQDNGFKLWRKVQPWYRKYFYFTRKK